MPLGDRALYLNRSDDGLRQGELIALRWRDVDFNAGRVTVRQNYVLGEFGTPKSRRSTRSVPLADEVARDLAGLDRAAAGIAPDDLVFADPHTGGPLDKAAILRRFRRALKAAQREQSHRFHDLRHTFGTRMAATGVPLRTLQEWMGHCDIETTQRYATSPTRFFSLWGLVPCSAGASSGRPWPGLRGASPCRASR